MDELENVEKQEQDKIRIFNIMYKLCAKHANKWCKSDAEKITCIIDISAAFLANMTFNFQNEKATKADYLRMISFVNQLLQAAFTEILNNIFTEKRILQ